MRRQQTEYQKTFNDVLMQIAGPALIMFLVGSLIFFLALIFYEGQFPGRVRYIFGLFTFAAVLISRISIEDGLERAFFYGIALGLVIWFVACFFLKLPGALAPLSFAVNGLMIAFVWWCAGRLTWDCTINDSSRDVTSTGLVELVRRKVRGGVQQVRATVSDNDETSSIQESREPLISVQDSATEQVEIDEANVTWDKKILNMWPFKRKKNTPGLWILYFSLMAIPIFGLGQAFIPAGKIEDRRYAFILFVVYVAAALGLLMMTSLMGLQRYLKRRNTAMPDSIAKTWMIFGTILAIVILSFVWLLPRPAPEYSLTQLLPKFSTPERNSSRWGWGKESNQNDKNANRSESKDDAEKTSSRKNAKNNGGDAQGKQKSSGGEKSKQKSKSGKSDGKSKSGKGGKKKSDQGKSSGNKNKSDKSKNSGDQSKSSDSKSSSKDQSDQKKGDPGKSKPPPGKNSLESGLEQKKNRWNKKSKEKSGSNGSPSSKNRNKQNSDRPPDVKNPPPPPTNRPPPMNPGLGLVASMIKWISIIILLIVIGVFAYIYRKELLASLKSLVQSMKDFFAGLFGNKDRTGAEPERNAEGKPIVPVKPFAAYRNPFTSGDAARMTPEQLIVYTFEAFQAWGRLFQCPRLADQTPHEYSRQLAKIQKALPKQQSDAFADLVCQEMFGPSDIDRSQLSPLKSFWTTMQNGAPAAPPMTAQLAPAQ